MLRGLLSLLLVTVSAFGQATKLSVVGQQSTVLLSWTASPSGGTVDVYRAGKACSTTPAFMQIASGVAAGGPYSDANLTPAEYCYYVTAVVNAVQSAPSNTVDLVVPTPCPGLSTSTPTQLTFCDAVPAPGTPCTVSTAGTSTVCRVSGALNISENGNPFQPVVQPVPAVFHPTDVFKFVAPTNIVVSPTTTYYLGSLVALGHNPDMVYLAPNACTLNKIVYDARMSGALSTPITISMWDITQNVQIPNSATTQTWTGVTVETVAAPAFAVAANDQLQVRFFMPAGVPSGFYINMTVTAYCTDN